MKRTVSSAEAPKNLLHRGFQVVVSEDAKDSRKILKRVLVSLKKRLLGRAMISSMEGRTTHHAAHRKDLQLYSFTIELRPRFIPINLAFLSRCVDLRHTGRAC